MAIKPFHVTIFLFFLFILFKRPKRKFITENEKYIFYSFLIYLGLTILQSSYSYSQLYSVFYIILTIIILIFFLIAFTSPIDKKGVDQLLRNYFLLTVLISVMLYTYSLPTFMSGHIPTGTDLPGMFVDRGMPRLAGFHEDPNIVCIFFSTAAFYFFSQRGTGSKLFFFLSVICLVSTFSRGGLAAFLFFFILYLLYTSQKYKYFKFMSITGICSIFGVYIHQYIDLVDIINRRLSNIASASGRSVIWDNVWRAVVERPLHGYGPYSMKEYGLNHWEKGRLAHNTPLQIWFDQGLIGLVCYYSIFLLILMTLYFRAGKRSWQFWSFLSICAISLNVSIGIDEVFFTLVVVLLLSSRKYRSV